MAHIVEKVRYITLISSTRRLNFQHVVQKIKHNLIRKAQLKKELARARIQEGASGAIPLQSSEPQIEPASIEPHPDRQALMDAPADTIDEPDKSIKPMRRERRPRVNPFNRETTQAQKRKEEADERRQIREQADAERKKKLEDRERMRKAVAKARKPGSDGRRRLGRESIVLLERVKKLMGHD
jgi:hypothetical protein